MCNGVVFLVVWLVEFVVNVLVNVVMDIIVDITVSITVSILVVIVVYVLMGIVVVTFFDLSVVVDGFSLNWHVNVLGLVCNWLVISVMSLSPDWHPFNVSLSVINWLVLGLTREVLVLCFGNIVMRSLIAVL